MNTANIVKFLQTVYTDEKLASLLAHAQDGKLGYGSCCCLIGVSTADHALQRPIGLAYLMEQGIDTSHYSKAYGSSDLAPAAQTEFARLGRNDDERRANIIPLIEAEIARRSRIPIETPEFEQVSS